jgi:hypothetical protein
MTPADAIIIALFVEISSSATGTRIIVGSGTIVACKAPAVSSAVLIAITTTEDKVADSPVTCVSDVLTGTDMTPGIMDAFSPLAVKLAALTLTTVGSGVIVAVCPLTSKVASATLTILPPDETFALSPVEVNSPVCNGTDTAPVTTVDS